VRDSDSTEEETARGARSVRVSKRRLDAAGLVLVIAAGGWSILAWLGVGGEPWGILGLLAAVTAAVVAGRATARLVPWAPAACIVAVGAGLVATWGSHTWSSSSWGDSLGYANARAAFFVVVAIAALQLAVASKRLWPLGLGLAVVGGIVPVAIRSKSASALLVVAAVVFLVGLGEARRRLAVTMAGAITGLVLLGTLIAGATHGPRAPAGDVLEDRLSTRRLTLWHESMQLIREHPLIGVGPGRFRLVSPTARSDPDAAWAHHEFLQQGVETGLPGMVLAVALVGWGFVALRRVSGPLSPSAAAALLAVAAHACVDYILHFPAVPIAAALLVGAGSAASRRKPDTRTERQETSP
jgi:O-antigen ligase